MMTLDLHYVDPRLVALYDTDNPRGADTDFYMALAAELDARTVADLGCGTGLLALELATGGRSVIGIDPAPAMLAVAQQKPGANGVTWIEGDSTALCGLEVDLVVMTGNVAQVFVGDSEWAATLRNIHAGLRAGGHLAFESRNPADRPWERWTREATFERIDSPNAPMECWLEVVRVGDGVVQFEGHNVFESTGELVVAPSQLRFRSAAELSDSLIEAGFAIEGFYGDWIRGPVTAISSTLVFVARK